MKVLKKYARAKINLGLQVLNKENNGYHNINTIFRPIDLYDILIYETRDDISISTSMDTEIPLQSNLIYKAIRSIFEYKNLQHGIHVKVIKNIPSGAGLGGGSSDAASTLKAVNTIFSLNLSYNELFELALNLGADVPFFLKDGTAEGRSRGQNLSYFNLYMPYYVLIVHPNIHVSTKEAYESLNRNYNTSNESYDYKDLLITSINNPDKFRDLLVNDFEETVFEKYPKIANIKSGLYIQGAKYASMSGSGSSVYGFYSDFDTAKRAQKHFEPCFTYISFPGF